MARERKAVNMERITIFDLIAMYDCVHHKISGVALNQVSISWRQWISHSARYDADHSIDYCLDPASKEIQICFPEFDMSLV